jgi:hypothetical protein
MNINMTNHENNGDDVTSSNNQWKEHDQKKKSFELQQQAATFNPLMKIPNPKLKLEPTIFKKLVQFWFFKPLRTGPSSGFS